MLPWPQQLSTLGHTTCWGGAPKAIRCRNWLQSAAASTLGPHLSGGSRSRGTSAGGSRLLGQLQDMVHIAERLVQKPA